MQELKTIADKISRVQATVYRKLRDLNITKLGTKCQILRITSSLADDWGQTVEDLKDMIIDSVFIKRPWAGKIQSFGQLNQATQEVENTAFDIFEYLPTEIFIPFKGDHDSVPVELMKNDIIVQVLRDEHDIKIPIIYQITRGYKQITVFTVCGANYECALYRGTLAPNILAAVNLYVNSIE